MKKTFNTLLIILISVIIIFTISYIRNSLEYQYKQGYDMAFIDCENGYVEGYNNAIYDFTYDWMPITFCEAIQIDKYCEWLDQIRPKYLVSEDCLYYFQEKIFREAIEIIKE